MIGTIWSHFLFTSCKRSFNFFFQTQQNNLKTGECCLSLILKQHSSKEFHELTLFVFCSFCFRIKITEVLDYSPHSEEVTPDSVPSADVHAPIEPLLQQENIVTKKPILMVKVENVLHEPFKLTEEVKVKYDYIGLFQKKSTHSDGYHDPLHPDFENCLALSYLDSKMKEPFHPVFHKF